ncbi:MAG: hypothetical protein COB76_03150 [Alphaproteobacteria bacterium]|nr:MAG: hypothetical protein COB76_03150 [Alphaproteobacteria bacterium]
MTSKQTIEALSRTQMAQALPDAIETAIQSYRDFMRQDNSETPKMFGDHHNACKAAIAHIELLLKLARWIDLDDQNNQQKNRIKKLLNNAQNELDGTKGGHEE